MIDSAICAERIEGQPEVRVVGFVSKLQCQLQGLHIYLLIQSREGTRH